MRGAALLLVAALLAAPVAAQDYGGVFVSVNDHGEPVTLVLKQDAVGQIGGTLTAPGVSFRVEGYVEGGGAVGAIYNRQIGIHFYAELRDEGLTVTLVELDGSGQPDFDRTTELSFARGARSVPADPSAAPTGARESAGTGTPDVRRTGVAAGAPSRPS